MQSGYGKHLHVSGWKSAQASSSSPAVDEGQPLCLFVLELVLFVKAGGQIHPAVILTSRPSVSVLGELTDLGVAVYTRALALPDVQVSVRKYRTPKKGGGGWQGRYDRI